MGEPMERKFSWVLKNFSSLQDDEYYSRPFAVAGHNWRLLACPKGQEADGYLSLYLELVDPPPDESSLPPAWRRDVNFSITLVSKSCGKSNKVLGGLGCFDTKHTIWGHDNFLSLTTLNSKDEGFLVKNRLIIVAEMHVFPALVVVPEEVMMSNTGPLTSTDENQADDDASARKSQENEDMKLVDDDGASEEMMMMMMFEEDVDNDDVSSPFLDEGGEEDMRSILDQSKSTIETEVSNDVTSKENDFEASLCLVSNDSASNGTSLDHVKSLEDASRTIENGGRGGFSTDTSVTETANNLLTTVQPAPAKETMSINGFDVFTSQVESVKLIFERHPDIAVEFNAKNQHLRNACITFLLSLVETLCQPLEKLSNEDLVQADIALTYLKDAGFKVDWLEKKLDQVKDKKEKEKSCLAGLQEIEENLQKLKQKCSELDVLADEEKAELSATRTALSFEDLV